MSKPINKSDTKDFNTEIRVRAHQKQSQMMSEFISDTNETFGIHFIGVKAIRAQMKASEDSDRWPLVLLELMKPSIIVLYIIRQD